MARNVRVGISDTWKCIKGLITLSKFLISDEHIPIAISSFATNSMYVNRGEGKVYEVVLSNNSSNALLVRLVIDFYLKDRPVHPHGHHAYFEKRVVVSPVTSQSIKFTYHWKERAEFEIDGVNLLPDNIWRGECNINSRYLVHAVLLDNEGTPFDQLTIIQEVTG